jgi:hypothetical protein
MIFWTRYFCNVAQFFQLSRRSTQRRLMFSLFFFKFRRKSESRLWNFIFERHARWNFIINWSNQSLKCVKFRSFKRIRWRYTRLLIFWKICQAHKDSIVYLVTKRRRSKKWKRKKGLWELINLRRLFSLTNLFNTDHLTRRLTRNRDTTLFSILIRQGSFDASCLNDETILISRFCVNIVSFDAKARSLLNNDEFHLFFHFIQNVFNHVFCLLYTLLSSAERVDEMRH